MRIDRKRLFFIVVDGHPRRVEDRKAIQPLNGSRPFVRLASIDGSVVAEELKIQRGEQMIGMGSVGIPVGTIAEHVVFERAIVHSS